MARIRTIKPEFWEDESIGTLSHGARLLFLGCLNLSDDEGLLRWNEMYLGSTIFPYDDIKGETVSKWMSELINAELIFIYRSVKTNQQIGLIVAFHKHQRVDKPQAPKFPAPNYRDVRLKQLIAKRDGYRCHICGGSIIPNDDIKKVGSKALSLDHVKPQAKGGSDYPSNLKAAHLSCNKSKKDNYDEGFDDSENHSENHSENYSQPERKGKEGNGKERNGNAREGFDENFLIPQIIAKYAEVFPEFIRDDKKDKFSARRIFEIIAGNANVEKINHDEFLFVWQNLCEGMRDKKSVQFYAGNGLTTIANNLPTIIQKIRNNGSRTNQSRTYSTEDFTD
jgi:5-methylcytosine-specific restriction endonuclease McrA